MTPLSALLVLATVVVESPAEKPDALLPGDLATTEAVPACAKYGERNSGITRICFYECSGAIAEISVPAATLCPF